MPKRILIADDDRDLVGALAARCGQLGVKTLLAYDAMTALEQIRRLRPDVVCLDVSMPAGNGLSVCEMLASDEELSSIAVIILTGKEDEDTIRRCHQMCAYYVLKSPSVWDRLKPVLCELLEIDQAQLDQPAPPDPVAWQDNDRTTESRFASRLGQRSLNHLLEVVARKTDGHDAAAERGRL